MTGRGAAVLGIGSMIGAGIFALLGEAGAVAGAAVWISFLLGGVVATLLGYVCVKLGTRYPSSGGLITYLVEGFGNGRLVGVASWLGYIAAIVIVTAMVAVSFGSYATTLFVGEDAGAGWDNLFTTIVVVAMVGDQRGRSPARRSRAVVDRRRCSWPFSRCSSPSRSSTSTPICSLSAATPRCRRSSPASRSRSSPTSAST